LVFIFDPESTSYDIYMLGLFQFYFIAIVYVGIFAFAGWLPLAIIAKWRGVNRKTWFALGGAFVGLAAVILETTTMMGGFFYDFPKEMRLVPIVGGLFGGLAYWAVTVKSWSTAKEMA
jgi:hypothetical protein